MGITDTAANMRKQVPGIDAMVFSNIKVKIGAARMGAKPSITPISVNTLPSSEGSTIFDRWVFKPIGPRAFVQWTTREIM